MASSAPLISPKRAVSAPASKKPRRSSKQTGNTGSRTPASETTPTPSRPRYASGDWTLPLRRPVHIRRWRKLKTLADVRDFILNLPEGKQKSSTWTAVSAALLQAAQRGDTTRATIALETAMMMERNLPR
jgi:hypothetical protein